MAREKRGRRWDTRRGRGCAHPDGWPGGPSTLAAMYAEGLKTRDLCPPGASQSGECAVTWASSMQSVQCDGGCDSGNSANLVERSLSPTTARFSLEARQP